MESQEKVESNEEVKKCPNCSKELKPGEGIRRENGHYCCDACCEAGSRIEQKKKEKKDLTCEFC